MSYMRLKELLSVLSGTVVPERCSNSTSSLLSIAIDV